jgi:hypothetical protein
MSLKVSTRMYKVQELGDCFLLRFAKGSGKSKKSCNVLIDCGSFRNKKESVARMNEIAASIKKDIGDEPLHVVIGTHQHNDHLSGFVHAEKIFETIDIEQVWLSWLDNPKDKLASGLRKEQEKALTKLEFMARALHARFPDSHARHRVTDVLGFSGDIERKNLKEPLVPAKGIEFLKRTGNSPVQYLEPGQILDLPNLKDSVKVYVLGPPMNRDLLRDISASGDESYDHRLAAASTQADNIVSAFSNYNKVTDDEEPDLEKWEELHFPFTDFYKIRADDFPTWEITLPDGTKSDRCKKVWASYNNKKQAWRKIDDEWLDEAGNLALYMDSYTNNTSLVVAFELVDAGKFLLFVGDAQTGNWISWKNIEWDNPPKNFTLDELLANTILYKVGHHCSHNATLKQGGLELMGHEHLVAMIPVDESDSNIMKPNGWKMPAKNLYKKLLEKTRNRVMRMDHGFGKNCAPVMENGKGKWDSMTLPHSVENNDLYVEYTITLK